MIMNHDFRFRFSLKANLLVSCDESTMFEVIILSSYPCVNEGRCSWNVLQDTCTWRVGGERRMHACMHAWPTRKKTRNGGAFHGRFSTRDLCTMMETDCKRLHAIGWSVMDGFGPWTELDFSNRGSRRHPTFPKTCSLSIKDDFRQASH